MRITTLCVAFILLGAATGPSLTAQQPAQPQLVVQAANTAPTTPAAAKPAGAPEDATSQIVIKALEDAKKANAELLKKQEATLQQLDDLQKAADQLRIFSKRN
jgi:hypothetical protein